ncbi:hypothetical protein FRX31_015657, partial [Thalictrum thalictroides]
MVFCGGDTESAHAIKKVFTDFHAITGLSANEIKSTIIYGGGSEIEKVEFASVLNMAVSTPPITYLGIPLLASRLTRADCLPLVERMVKAVIAWAAQKLSYT